MFTNVPKKKEENKFLQNTTFEQFVRIRYLQVRLCIYPKMYFFAQMACSKNLNKKLKNMKNKQKQSTVDNPIVDNARPAKVAKQNEFYYQQGYFRAYIDFVLLKSNDEKEIADCVIELLDEFILNGDNTNMIVVFFKLSIKDGLLQFEDIDKLMLALINTDQDEDILGWLSESFSDFKKDLAL